MGKRGKATTLSATDNGPRNNLSEQLEWVKKRPTNGLQQCLNSHVINAYLDGRAARKEASSHRATSSDPVEDVAEMINRGASAIGAFRRLSGFNSAEIQAVPLPKSVLSIPPPLVPFAEGIDEVPISDPDDENAPVTDRSYDHHELQRPATRPTSFSVSTNSVGTSQNHPRIRKLTDWQATSQSPPSEFDIHDSLFDEVDVDALLAGRAPLETSNGRSCTNLVEEKQLPGGVLQPHSLNPAPPINLQTHFNPVDNDGERIHAPETDSSADSIRELIKVTRERLRQVREMCDDAFLEGDVPTHLTASRAQLEAKLEALSREYRHLKTEQIGEASSHSARLVSTPSDRSILPSSTHAAKEIPTDPGVPEKMVRARRVLRDVFGHNAFRPNQERVVMEAFSRRDVFVLMPTGGGKSLCYQLPACVDDGVTVVISPLVSLIQDQVQQLEALDVGVAHLNGEQDYDTIQRPIISQLFSNRIRIKLLYVTPEKIASSNTLNNIFESLEKRKMLARFIVDEAHCISQWGHDFRKDYFQLGQLRTKFKSIPIMALTATANIQTEADIVKNLQLSNPFITRSSFNRPNLTYEVRRKSGKFMDDIAAFVRERMDDSGIIYCLSKKDCEQVAEKLIKTLGLENTRRASSISFYHAGLEAEERAHRHHEWSKGKIKLIVATVAFGMGINKPDVRYVIHHTIPQSVTHYYQEAGRAGRDGEVASCILYYSYPDITRRRKLLTKDDQNKHHLNVHFENLRRMADFCENQVECRRTSLLEYFGENFSSEKCRQTCDNCKNRAQGVTAEKVDVTNDCLALLDMVRTLQADNESNTLVQVSQLYLGQVVKGKEHKKDQYTKLAGFGAGLGRFERSEIERVIYHMILKQYLREVDKKNRSGFTTTFLGVGCNANKLSSGERVRIVCKTRYDRRRDSAGQKKPGSSSKKGKTIEKIPIKKSKPLHARKTVPKSSSVDLVEELSDDFDEDVVEVLQQPPPNRLVSPTKDVGRIPLHHVEALAQLLKDWRASVCDNFNVMPYHILPTGGIAAIANAVPVTNTELSEIEGVGRIRVKKYGDAIIEIVKTYLDKHNLTPAPSLRATSDPSGSLQDPERSDSASISAQNPSKTRDEFDEDDIDWGALDDDLLIQTARSKRKLDSNLLDDEPTKRKHKK